MGNVFEGSLHTGKYQSFTYAQEIQLVLNRVAELVSFIESEHFGVDTLFYFWHGEKRAQITVQTIGRLLGRPLTDELVTIHDLIETAISSDLLDFSENYSPKIFKLIQGVRPQIAGSDTRTTIEQFHYSVDVRQALLQHVLTKLNERYQTPRFRDLGEASRWTQAFSDNLAMAEDVINETRQLLKAEVQAGEQHLEHVAQIIERIEANAEAKLGVIKRLQWVSALEEAENTINNHLADRAEQMEAVTFSMFTEASTPSFFQLAGPHLWQYLAPRHLPAQPRGGGKRGHRRNQV